MTQEEGMVPVHERDGKWWFYDELWSDELGPFDSKEEAAAACRKYGRELAGTKCRIPVEPVLSKRMQKFREDRGEGACAWPGYWVAEVGEMEAYIKDLTGTAAHSYATGSIPGITREHLDIVSTLKDIYMLALVLGADPQDYRMRAARDSLSGKPTNDALADARRQGRLELEQALEQRMCVACRDGNEPRRADNAWLHDRLDWNGNPGSPFLCGATVLRDIIAALKEEEA